MTKKQTFYFLTGMAVFCIFNFIWFGLEVLTGIGGLGFVIGTCAEGALGCFFLWLAGYCQTHPQLWSNQ